MKKDPWLEIVSVRFNIIPVEVFSLVLYLSSV